MLTSQEEQFIRYWEANRAREKKTMRQLIIGIPVGLLFALPVLFLLFSGRFWYKRADMIANSQMNPVVLIAGIVLITAFVAIFYKHHQWEMKEQQYLELKSKQEDGDETGNDTMQL